VSLRTGVKEYASLARFLIKWSIFATPVGLMVGSACALFLWSLDEATTARLRHPHLLYGLPAAGMLIAMCYSAFGKSVEGGNNLIVDEIHEPGGGVPVRMAPLILAATVVTHLFGGSAGREGTAVQMGGSIASGLAKLLPSLSRADVRLLLMAGVSAGFGGVFGTPIAGAIFAMEVLVIGRMVSSAWIPCLVAGIVSDQTCAAWGIGHTHYHIQTVLGSGTIQHLAPIIPVVLLKAGLAGVAFGLVSLIFAELVHGLQHLFKKSIPWPFARPVVGGLLIIGLVTLIGRQDYLGLGVSSDDPNTVTIVSSFREGGADSWSWLAKLAFTAITLSSGFKGGEVTPLFFIGAALGNSLAILLGAPVDLFAALGFLAVFSGATNTPLACTVMGVELFGGEYLAYFATACSVAYLFSGHSGIYLSQRIGSPKGESSPVAIAETLRKARDARPALFSIRPSRSGPDFSHGENLPMQERHRVVSKETGQLRIYLPQGETRHGMGLRSLFGRPLFRELIDLAKQYGILNATSHSTHYGFSNNGRVHSDGSETPNPHLSVCVELIDRRDRLEEFCHQNSVILKDRVMVFKHLEHWELHAELLDVTEAGVEELRESGEPRPPRT